MKLKLRGIGFIIVTIVTIIILLYAFYATNLGPKNKNNEQLISFTVEPGSSSKKIISELYDAGLIKNKMVFEIYHKLNPAEFKTGTYQLSQVMNVNQISTALQKGPTQFETEFTITIPEGWKLEAIAEAFSLKTIYSKQELLDAWNSDAYVREMIEKHWYITDDVLNDNLRYSLEGYLFPDTYTFMANNLPPEAYSNYMIETLGVRLADYQTSIENNVYGMTTHEVLSLASVIQGETLFKEDMPKISGVFHKRLEIGMKLESDITVLYALNEHYNQVLYTHLEVDSPYNTYKIPALPVGPINSPGLDSILSAVNPEMTSALFFFSKEDGTTIYSETFEEHEKVARENKWSTWQ